MTDNYYIETDPDAARRFSEACAAAAKDDNTGIGSLAEKSVHRALKYFYEPDRACHEVSIGGYVADIVDENGIVEIQSGSFGSMKKKLAAFLDCSRVTVVYPWVVSKRILMIDPGTGEVLYSRKSPKKGRVYDIIRELWGISDFLGSDRLEIRVAVIETEEIREPREHIPPGRRRRKKDHIITDKRPTAFLGEMIFRGKEDYRMFLPDALPDSFTTADLRSLTGIDSLTACSTVNLLCKLTVIEKDGKRGNAYVYRKT